LAVIAGIILTIAFVILGIYSVVPWAWSVAPIILTLFGFFLDYWFKDEKAKSIELRREEKRNVILDRTVRVGSDGAYYDLIFKKGDHIRGELSSDNPMSFFFVDERNFFKWERNRTFDYEYGSEDIFKASIDFVVPKRGTWYLLLEMSGRQSAKAKAYVYKEEFSKS